MKRPVSSGTTTMAIRTTFGPAAHFFRNLRERLGTDTSLHLTDSCVYREPLFSSEVIPAQAGIHADVVRYRTIFSI